MGIRRGIERWRQAKRKRQLERGTVVQKSVPDGTIRAFAAEIRANIESVPLIRIGGEGDGGYLLPDDFDGIRHCFSPGVDVTTDFEADIARRYGIKSFMADASVESAPFDNPLFEFDRKFLGARSDKTFTTLGAWVDGKLGETADDDLLLQMDIEGGEFDVLIESEAALLRRFRMMVIEFHNMERVFEQNSLPLIRAIFAKLHRDFAIVHMHANNYYGLSECKDVAIPPLIEISYLRRDRLAPLATGEAMAIPHPLDRPNVPTMPDILMPQIWSRG